MLIEGDKNGVPEAAELLALVTYLTSEDEPRTVEYQKGYRTQTRNYFTTDPENMYAVSMTKLEHEPVNRLTASRLGKLLLGNKLSRACLIINDLQNPENSKEVIITDSGIAVLEGKHGSKRKIRDPLRRDTCINDVLTKLTAINAKS